MRSSVRAGVVVAMAVATALAIAASSVRSEISGRDAQALSKASLIYLATVRKDGNQSKAAPVWFTTSADNNAILIQTGVARLEGQAHQTRQHGSRVDRFRNRSGL